MTGKDLYGGLDKGLFNPEEMEKPVPQVMKLVGLEVTDSERADKGTGSHWKVIRLEWQNYTYPRPTNDVREIPVTSKEGGTSNAYRANYKRWKAVGLSLLPDNFSDYVGKFFDVIIEERDTGRKSEKTGRNFIERNYFPIGFTSAETIAKVTAAYAAKLAAVPPRVSTNGTVNATLLNSVKEIAVGLATGMTEEQLSKELAGTDEVKGNSTLLAMVSKGDVVREMVKAGTLVKDDNGVLAVA